MKRPYILLNNTQRYALTGASFGLLFPIMATVIQVLDSGLTLNISSMAAVQSAEPLLWIIDTAPIFLSVFAAVGGRRQDALEKVNNMLRSRERELETAQLILEERVNERTNELTSMNQLVMERAEQLRSVVDTTHSLLSIQDLDRLLPLVVQIISQQFNYYHAGIYLLDEQKQHAVLLAASSEGGLRILQRGQYLKIGEQSLVDSAIRSGQARIVSDTNTDAMFRHEPELPNTRSELVLPLRSGGNVIGALDLQSDAERVFTDEYVSVLSILADQVAIAIQNAILQEKTQRKFREVETSSRQVSARSWSGWVESIRARGYRYDGIRSEPLKEAETSSFPQTRDHSIPIRLRGRTIGNLKIKLSEPSQSWTDDDHAIAEATAERTALALEGARLLDEAKKRAAREAFLSEVAAKLSTSFQLDSILRDTVEELGQTLEGSTVSFQLINPSALPGMESTRLDGSPVERKDSE